MATDEPADPATQYANYADYVAQVVLASQTGSVQTIPNDLASGELDTALLLDPVKIQAYRDSIAGSMNDQKAGGARLEDLADRIADVIIETTVQGAGTLEVHVIDPMLVLVNSGFIQTDETGYLYPPIDINFPTDTNCVWRLCQYNATWSTDRSSANLILTFEDRIISILRTLSAANGGKVQGGQNQTLSGFVQELVQSANTVLSPTPAIQFVPLIASQDPNYTPELTQTASHPEKNLRKDPLKQQKGLDGDMQRLIASINQHQLGGFPTSGSTTIAQQENRLAKILGLTKAPDPLKIGNNGVGDGFPDY